MNIENAIKQLFDNQGFAYSFSDGKLGSEKGYFVAIDKKHEYTIQAIYRYKKSVIKDKIKAYALDNIDLLNQENKYLGAWVSEGRLFLDISELVFDENMAIELCRQRGQLAYYDNNLKQVKFIQNESV